MITTDQASIRRILKSVVPVTAGAQALSFVSSLALANVLGATQATDAYFLGLSVPMITFGILLAAVRLGALPTLTEWRARHADGFTGLSSELFTGVTLAALLISVVATVIALIAMPAAISGSSGKLLHLTRIALVELAPLGVLGAMIGILGAILAACGSFVPAAAILGLEPVAKTLFVVFLGHKWGATTLVVGNLVGSALAVPILVLEARRRGVRVGFVRRFNTPVLRRVLQFSVPLLISQSVLQVNPLIDRSMAASLGSGSITELELGLRLFQVPTALVTSTLIAPLTATWAARLAASGWEVLRESFTRALNAVILFIPPLVAVGLLLKDHLIWFLYQGGAYSASALHHTGDAFGMLVLGLPAQVLVVVVSTLFIVQRDSVFPMKIALANVVLNVVLNLALRGPLGVAGIALSTSLTLSLLFCVSALVAQRRWRVVQFAEIKDMLGRSAAATLAIAVAGAAVLSAGHFGRDRVGDVVAIASVSAIVAAVYAIAQGVGMGRRHNIFRWPLRTGRVDA